MATRTELTEVFHRRSDRLNKYIGHATRLDPDQVAALGDPLTKQALFEEISRTREPPPQRGQLKFPLAAAAAGVTVAALVGGIVAASGVLQPQNRPPAASVPINPTSTRHGDVFPGHTASCVEEYNAATLTKRAFAFDGTVTSIGTSPVEDPSWPRGGGPNPYVPVTFTVNHWYRGGDSSTITVAMLQPNTDSSYQIGSRLLVTGEPQWGGAPLDNPVAWSCGFTRWYTAAEAAVWDEVFR